MANKINLNDKDITLSALFKEAEKWTAIPVAQLTKDQIAVLALKKLVDAKRVGAKSSVACFICWTGA